MTPPKMAPWNLALRFILEIAALVGLGAMAWDRTHGVMQWGGVILLPLVAAVVWGSFAVADDPSRSGNAPVPVSGWVRLGLELMVLLGGAAALGMTWGLGWGVAMAAVVVVHYLFSAERIRWLIAQ